MKGNTLHPFYRETDISDLDEIVEHRLEVLETIKELHINEIMSEIRFCGCDNGKERCCQKEKESPFQDVKVDNIEEIENG